MQIERNKFLQSSLLFLLFAVLAILALFPFYSLALASLKPSKEMLRYGLNVKLQPELLSFHNYSFLFSASAKSI